MKTLLFLLVPAASFAAVSEGKLATRHHGETIDVPLEHTAVKIQVVGQLAEVSVEQRFHNPYDNKIDAVYMFPLPTGAAVNRLEIVSGGRTIRGAIALREEAQRKYVAAQQKGQVAALLTEERPNLFTQQVANLEPAARVIVRLHYVQSLEYDAGRYEVVFPMVAGPRYMPKSKGAQPPVQPSVLPPGLRSSHEISLAVDLDPGVPLQSLESPSHRLVGSGGHVELAPGDTIPNKDFILRWQVAGAQPQLALMAHREGGDGSFFLLAQPPLAPPEAEPRELIFVLDTSSSMAGRPLQKARELVRRSLAGLRATDTFQMVCFGDDASALGPRMLAPKPKNVGFALQWMDALKAEGGTEMMSGLSAALALPHDPARLRIVVLVTDGYLGNEDEVLAMAGRELGAARLFSFGVGSAVNRYLLEELAQLGRGAATVVRPDEDTTQAVERFHARIDRPLLTDVRIDWGGLTVKDVTPVRDLFAGQPLVVSGHYGVPGAATVTVHARQAGREVRFPLAVTLPAHDASRPPVPLVWARARIAELERRLVRGEDPKIADEIRALALKYGILTRYTAFVAVDEASRTSGRSTTVNVPVAVPEHVRGGGSQIDDTYVASGFGVVGHGYGGGGSGEGTIGLGSVGTIGKGAGYSGASYGMVAHRVAAPAVVLASPTIIRGSLDKDTIRRIIRRHINEVKFCYEKELLKLPSLTGRVEIRFTITSLGVVSSAEVASSTLANENVESCVVGAVRRWEFVAVPDSVAQVTYPFVFKPGEVE